MVSSEQVCSSICNTVWLGLGFPMRKKSNAHEGLLAMAHGDGVPPLIVMDGAKKQMMGKFRCKARQMGIHVKQTEPYSPWQNVAKGAIHEVKHHAGRKMA